MSCTLRLRYIKTADLSGLDLVRHPVEVTQGTTIGTTGSLRDTIPQYRSVMSVSRRRHFLCIEKVSTAPSSHKGWTVLAFV
jgi:hypothetical protein